MGAKLRHHGTGAKQRAFRFGRRPPGSLDIHFDGGGQNLSTEQIVAFFDQKRLKVELNRFPDIGHGILERIPLRLASLQFGAPSVETVFIFLDYDARLAGHGFSVSRWRRQPDARFSFLIDGQSCAQTLQSADSFQTAEHAYGGERHRFPQNRRSPWRRLFQLYFDLMQIKWRGGEMIPASR